MMMMVTMLWPFFYIHLNYEGTDDDEEEENDDDADDNAEVVPLYPS